MNEKKKRYGKGECGFMKPKRMLQRIVSSLVIFLLVITTCLSQTNVVYARTNCTNTSISKLTLYDDGSIKSMEVTYDWHESSRDYQYFAVFDDHTEADLGTDAYWWFYDGSGTTSIQQGVAGFVAQCQKAGKNIACYSFTTQGISSQISNECKATLNFAEGVLKKTATDKSYRIVLFIDQGKTGLGYRPTDPIGIITIKSDGSIFYRTEGKADSNPVKPAHTHDWSGWKFDSTQHWKECSGCTETNETAPHISGHTSGICETCGYKFAPDPDPVHTHSYVPVYSFDAEYHWNECVAEGHSDTCRELAFHRFVVETNADESSSTASCRDCFAYLTLTAQSGTTEKSVGEMVEVDTNIPGIKHVAPRIRNLDTKEIVKWDCKDEGRYQASMEIDGQYLIANFTLTNPKTTAATGDNRPIELLFVGFAAMSVLAAAAFTMDRKRR